MSPQPKTQAKTAKVQRSTDMAWWCPHCDHSQTWGIERCAACGAERDGETVKASG